MNVRIRELLEKHGFIHDGMTVGEKNDALKKFERFSEVIARECADFVEQDQGSGSAMASRLKQHFGVE